MDDKRNEPDAEHFEAAIARHRLDLQTQLKRSTALPSAMFDATDAMLEAQLCAATEGIFQQLLEWDAPQALPTDGEQRLEKVSKHELTGLLVAALHGEFDGEAPKLDERAATEFAAILAEAAARSVGKAQQRSQQLLARQNAADAATVDDAARAIADGLAAILRRGDGARPDGDGDAVGEQELALRNLCERIADAAARSVAATDAQPQADARGVDAPNPEDDAS